MIHSLVLQRGQRGSSPEEGLTFFVYESTAVFPTAFKGLRLAAGDDALVAKDAKGRAFDWDIVSAARIKPKTMDI